MKILQLLIILIISQFDSNTQDFLINRAKKTYNYEQWKDLVEGPITRFHVNFSLSQLSTKWQLEWEEPCSYGGTEYRFTNKKYKGSHYCFKVRGLSSIRNAHQMILTELAMSSNPDIDVSRPQGWDFGDVYKAGYWSRDNVYIEFRDISERYLPVKLKKFNEVIDKELMRIPKVTNDDVKGKPVINTFEISKKMVAIGSDTPLKVIVDNTMEALPQLYYKIFIEGGRLYKEGNTYHYMAESDGLHTIKLYVTNKIGLTSMALLHVQVVKE